MTTVKETPGLMNRRPRPRGDSILTTGVTVTRGLVGLFVLAASLALIEIGKSHYKMDRARTDQGQASYATERAAPVTRAGLVLASASTQR